MTINNYIYANDGTIIDPYFCEWVEIDVSEDEEFDEIEERLIEGEGMRYEIVKGRIA
jgi:hypothetical protein